MLKAFYIPLTVVFFLLCSWAIALMIYHGRAGSAARPAAVGPRRLAVLVGLLLAAIYVYQATWQLAGFARPEFMDFMRKYSRRQVNPAREMARGRILDRNGMELAFTDRSGKFERRYPFSRACCHLVGYVHPMFGLAGLEAADNAYLSGLTVSSRGELERFGINILDQGRAGGNDLAITLDARLQARAVELLRNRPGAIVAIRPRDGALLALASSPTFDPERLDEALFRSGRTGASPLMNRALQGAYPAGSTIKVMIAACALENGFDGLIDCPPEGYTPPGRQHQPIRDHEYYECQRRGETWRGMGAIGLKEAFERSSNVFFAQLGVKLGSRRLDATAVRFLFNRPLIIFEGSSGVVAARASVWPAPGPDQAGQAAQLSIGQGAMLVTPLHMALIASAIANGGELHFPRLSARTPPLPPERIIERSVSEKLHGLMRHAVERGTGRGADISEAAIAGKTGTAQVPDGPDHSWFICFAPAGDPALAIAVIIEHGGYGSAAAVPAAADLVRTAKKIGLLEPVARENAAAPDRAIGSTP